MSRGGDEARLDAYFKAQRADMESLGVPDQT